MKLPSLRALRNFGGSLLLLLTFTACHTTSGPTAKAPVRVACVGDSITYGFGIAGRETNSYPAQLQQILGEGWQVGNFGHNGAFALRHGKKPYVDQAVYQGALAMRPDVVVIKLGTNDTNRDAWREHHDEFTGDYLALIRTFQALPSRPRIYLCRPVPLFRDRGKEYDTDKVLVEEIIPRIEAVAKVTKLPLIDLYTPFEGKEKMFPDGVHPDVNGAHIMAETVAAKLEGKTSVRSPRSPRETRKARPGRDQR